MDLNNSIQLSILLEQFRVNKQKEAFLGFNTLFDMRLYLHLITDLRTDRRFMCQVQLHEHRLIDAYGI